MSTVRLSKVPNVFKIQKFQEMKVKVIIEPLRSKLFFVMDSPKYSEFKNFSGYEFRPIKYPGKYNYDTKVHVTNSPINLKVHSRDYQVEILVLQHTVSYIRKL